MAGTTSRNNNPSRVNIEETQLSETEQILKGTFLSYLFLSTTRHDKIFVVSGAAAYIIYIKGK